MPDDTIGMLKRSALVTFLGLNILLTFVLASAAEKRVFKVLISPKEGDPDWASLNSSNLSAMLDKEVYAVRSARLQLPGEGRTVIVVDFAEASVPNDACMLAEALSAMQRFPETPKPVLLTAGDSRFVTSMATGPFESLSIFSGGSLKALAIECESGPKFDAKEGSPKEERWERSAPGHYLVANSVFASLRQAFASTDAPVRVFWLAETFRLFQIWQSPTCGPFWGIDCRDAPRPAFEGIEDVAEADLTFFPVVFAARSNRRIGNLSRAQLREAESLAEATGGFVSTMSGRPGDTLTRAMVRSSSGALLTLEGRVSVDGRRPTKVQNLKIEAGVGGRRAIWQRRFVVSREGSIHPSAKLNPLVVHSSTVGLSYGCYSPDSPAGGRTLNVTLPPEVLSAPSEDIDLQLRYPKENGLQIQRFTFARSKAGPASVCLPMIHARDGMSFEVILAERGSGEIWAVAGVLGATNGRP